MPRHRLLVLALAGLSALAVVASAQMRRPDPSTMSAYVLGIYTRGPSWTPGRTPHSDSIQAGHLANMMKMAEAGALIGAGPMANDGKIRGLLIFRDLPLDSVRSLVVKDPALQSSRLLLELHRWYAPRGIGEAYTERANRVPAKPDSMILLPVVFLTRPQQPPPADSTTAAVMAGHLGHIVDMLLSGQLLAAGPMFDDGELRGLSVFGTDTTTALRLSNEDPAVKAGRLEVKMLPWYVAWGVMPPKPTIKEMKR